MIKVPDHNRKLLYNRFGFKAEEFIVDFYEDYLDPQSRMSKNAFRLRLRALNPSTHIGRVNYSTRALFASRGVSPTAADGAGEDSTSGAPSDI
jgi:hypothetical protein